MAAKRKRKPVLTPQLAALELRKAIYSEKNSMLKKVYEDTLELIRQSKFGKRSTQILIDATPRGAIGIVEAGWRYTLFGESTWDNLMLSAWDNCEQIFQHRGTIEVIARPAGPASSSMLIKFVKQ